MRLLVLVLPFALGRVPWNDGETAACLLGHGPCDEGVCPDVGEEAFSRGCLRSRVPFRTAYARVKCCLRCCLRHWVRAYGLDERWAAFQAEEGATGRIDEVLVGHQRGGTLPFASRRVSSARMPWAADAWNAEMARECGGDGRECDATESDEYLWSARRTVSSGSGVGVGTWTRGADFWIELHFGDNCGEYKKSSPFGT